jgi:hypothetical protein
MLPGLPGVSVPGQPHPDERPIGVQIVAPFGHDAVVLEIAQRLEALTPWADRWPALGLTVRECVFRPGVARPAARRCIRMSGLRLFKAADHLSRLALTGHPVFLGDLPKEGRNRPTDPSRDLLRAGPGTRSTAILISQSP